MKTAIEIMEDTTIGSPDVQAALVEVIRLAKIGAAVEAVREQWVERFVQAAPEQLEDVSRGYVKAIANVVMNNKP